MSGPDDLLSRPIVLVVALAIISLLPFAFMTVTAFVKIATVLQIVRSAIGAQGVPSNTVVMALAAALTLIAMAPVTDKIVARAAPLALPEHLGHRVVVMWVGGITDILPQIRTASSEVLRAGPMPPWACLPSPRKTPA